MGVSRGWVDARGDVSPDCVLRLVGLPSLSPMKISTATGRCTTTANASGPTEEQVALISGAAADAAAHGRSRRDGDGEVTRPLPGPISNDLQCPSIARRRERVPGFLEERAGGWTQASSTLLRAVQTACHVFVEEHQERHHKRRTHTLTLERCHRVYTMIVQPLLSTAAPAAMTAVQLDNLQVPRGSN